MSDFVTVWKSMWQAILGNNGCITLYYNSSPIWCVDYVQLTAYVLFTILVIWLATLSIRLLRKIICGGVR